jgi:hypothetical protein
VIVSAVAMVRPRLGVALTWGVLVLAGLGDQARLQPEVLSLAVLMTAPIFGAEGIGVARWYLASLWLWSGLHKALSLGWSVGGASVIADALGAPGLRPLVAVSVPAIEIGLGVAAFWRATWPALRWVGAAFHVGVLLTLSPLFGDRNSAVWAWNVALAVASVILFAPTRDRSPATSVGQALGVACFVYPALFYVGWMDAYPSHNLYSSNTAGAAICSEVTDVCESAPFSEVLLEEANTPLPPEPRLYRAWFDEVCEPGTYLRVTGPATRLTDPPTTSTHLCQSRSRTAPSR